MIDPTGPSSRPSIARALLSAGVLGVGLFPFPIGWARDLRDAARSQGLNRLDREASAGGYYESLIGGSGTDRRGASGALETALIGRPIDHNRDLVKRITVDREADFLQFALKPGDDEVFFGRRFTTNARGMRDRDYPTTKPDGVYRIALLGASIDMGWGVETPDTYENRLEAWLNAEADRRGIARRFEVLNFSVAAYGPAQRFDAFRTQALAYAPDLVLLSSTMLDPRLNEIHLGGLIRNGVDLKYDFFRRVVAEAGVDPAGERARAWADLDRKSGFKARIKAHAWQIADAVAGELALECRSRDVALATLLVPRACRDDSGEGRDLAVARHAAIAARHALPFIDLSRAFDAVTPRDVEIAPGDDHPNTLGHELLFRTLSKGLLASPELSTELFDTPEG